MLSNECVVHAIVAALHAFSPFPPFFFHLFLPRDALFSTATNTRPSHHTQPALHSRCSTDSSLRFPHPFPPPSILPFTPPSPYPNQPSPTCPSSAAHTPRHLSAFFLYIPSHPIPLRPTATPAPFFPRRNHCAPPTGARSPPSFQAHAGAGALPK